MLLDNFYVNADVSADGHNWSTAAIAPDYMQKLWPNSYASRRKTYDYEEQDAASLPPAGYLWTNATAAGLSIRNFGYMVNNKTPRRRPAKSRSPACATPSWRNAPTASTAASTWITPTSSAPRVHLNDLAEFEKTGDMPRLIVMRMGNDHTNGTAAGKLSPLSFAADNDQGVGMMVEAVSKSKFWTSTAIFILEDDAQNGPDHVDSHRSPAFVISSLIKRHAVDSTMYNTTSMLRTMEFMLGLHPMTQLRCGRAALDHVLPERARSRSLHG